MIGSARLREVEVQALDAARLEPLIGQERMARYEAIAEATQTALAGRTVLNVNSTATGGGVAEMLQTLLAYGRGAGLDVRWLVIEGDPAFFAVTKRIHNGLYGSPGDGGELGTAERALYETVTRRNAEELRVLVRPGDVVLVHDPQPAGLIEEMKRAGAHVIWRCHVGRDEPNEWTERAWEFLRPYVEPADAFVVSRRAFAPPWMDEARTHVIAPSIDPFSAKNEPMSRRNSRQVLTYTGLLPGDGAVPAVPFTRRDGSPGRINRRADVLQTGPPPGLEVPLIVQVSRWDRMKDMAGVLRGFAQGVDPSFGAHLLLSGPAVTGVADDPEAAEVLDECMALWRALPHERHARAFTSLARPWPTQTRRPRSSTPSSVTQPSSSRRAWPKGSDSPSRRRCGRGVRLLRAPSEASVDQIDDGVNGVLLRDAGGPWRLRRRGQRPAARPRASQEAGRTGAGAGRASCSSATATSTSTARFSNNSPNEARLVIQLSGVETIRRRAEDVLHAVAGGRNIYDLTILRAERPPSDSSEPAPAQPSSGTRARRIVGPRP